MRQITVILLLLSLSLVFNAQRSFGYEPIYKSFEHKPDCTGHLLDLGDRRNWFKRAINPVLYDIPYAKEDLQQQQYKHLSNQSLYPHQALRVFVRSRINFTERELGIPVEDIIASKLGFFITRFEYWNDEVASDDKPSNLRVFSFLKHYSNDKSKGTRMITPFLIKTENSNKSLVSGASEFVAINLRTGRPKPLPINYWPLFMNRKSAETVRKEVTPSYKVDIEWLEAPLEHPFGVFHDHVRPEDLDPFKHMNSSRYLKVLLQSHEKMFQRKHSKILSSWLRTSNSNIIRYARIKFQNQLKLKDQYMIKNKINRISKDGNSLEVTFFIKNLSTNKIISSGRFIYSRDTNSNLH